MAAKGIKRARFKTIPGTIVECRSGMYLAFYETRTDIIAHGDSEVDAKNNLKKLYGMVMKHEKNKEDEGKGDSDLPQSFKVKKFTDKILAS